MRKTLLTMLALVCFFYVYSQKSQKVRNAEGKWQVSGNVTQEQAREKAIEEAKKDAMRKAGITERIKSSQTISAVESNKESAELFSMFSSIEMSGAVTDWNIKKEGWEQNSIDGLMYYAITIEATVKNYATIPDPEFKINVSGLRPNGYRNGEELTFSVTPNKTGFLRIFIFENNMQDATVLFPNEHELNNKLTEKQSVKFPTLKNADYPVEKTGAEPLEHNTVLFVFTKKDIPFHDTDPTTKNRILSWLNEIEPDQRDVVLKTIMISD